MWKKIDMNMNCELPTACIFLGDKWNLQEELQNVTMRSLPYQAGLHCYMLTSFLIWEISSGQDFAVSITFTD